MSFKVSCLVLSLQWFFRQSRKSHNTSQQHAVHTAAVSKWHTNIWICDVQQLNTLHFFSSHQQPSERIFSGKHDGQQNVKSSNQILQFCNIFLICKVYFNTDCNFIVFSDKELNRRAAMCFLVLELLCSFFWGRGRNLRVGKISTNKTKTNFNFICLTAR